MVAKDRWRRKLPFTEEESRMLEAKKSRYQPSDTLHFYYMIDPHLSSIYTATCEQWRIEGLGQGLKNQLNQSHIGEKKLYP